MNALPAKAWIVVTSYARLGLGSHDMTDDRDRAYDQFADDVRDGQPVLVLEHDLNAMRSRDATDDFEHMLHEIEIARGLDRSEVLRFAPPALEAAQ